MKIDQLQSQKNGTIALLKLEEDSSNSIKIWCDNHSIKCLNPEDLHCTVLYSRKVVPDLDILNGMNIKFQAKIIEWEKFDKALVLKLDSSKINKLHNIMMNQGGTHDFPEFIAHITVSYDYNDEIPVIIPKITVKFNKLLVEPIDKDFSKKIENDN